MFEDCKLPICTIADIMKISKEEVTSKLLELNLLVDLHATTNKVHELEHKYNVRNEHDISNKVLYTIISDLMKRIEILENNAK